MLTASPPLVANDSYSVIHDRVLSRTVYQAGVLGNDTASDGSSLSAILRSDVQHGSLEFNSDGTFTYTPDAGYWGTDVFTYEAYDGNSYGTDAATVAISVQESVPSVESGTFSIGHDRVLGGALPATDAEGDALLGIVVEGPTHGTVSLGHDGAFTYTPAARYYGADSFTYKVSDGLLTSDTATISLTVAETAPVAGNDYYSAGTSGTSILAFDSDADGDTLSPQIVAQPQHGTLNLMPDGTFTYEPNPGFAGGDAFTYRDSDGILLSNVATAYVFVGAPVGATLRGNGYVGGNEGVALATAPFLFWAPTFGSNSDYTSVIQWGDGTETTGIIAPSSFGFSMVQGAHTYNSRGTYSISVALLGNATAHNAAALFSNCATASIGGTTLTGASASSAPRGQGGAVAAANGIVPLTVVSTPVVTIDATQPEANAATGVGGTFTVTRTGDPTQALTVNYIVSGTAVAGTDFVSLSGSVTIPAGASSANINVTPFVDLNPLVPNPSTVVVTLVPSNTVPPSYTLSSKSITATDTVTATITGTQTGIVVSPTVKSSAVSLQLSGIPATITAGSAFNVTVSAVTATGSVYSGYTGTVSFTTNAVNASLPSSYTFTAADNGVHTFSATFRLAGTGNYLKASDTSTAGLTDLLVSPAAATHFTVANFPATAYSGAAQSFSVAAYDAYNNLATGYLGTVHFTSTDSQAVLPANYTFTAADTGIHTFAATLKTIATQGLTATDTVTSSINGTQSGISVVAAPTTASLQIIGVPTTAVAGTSFTFTVKALTAAGAVSTGYLGTVQFTSGDSTALLPANYTFTAADAGVHSFTVSFKAANNARWFKVSDTSASGLSTISTLHILPASASRFLVSGFSASIPAGYAQTIMVNAIDLYGNQATGFGDTVRFTSTDPEATLPADYTFTAADAGQHTFTATPHTSGPWTITVTDTQAPGVYGTMSGILITAPQSPTAASLRVTGVPTNVTSGLAYRVTVAAVDPGGNTVSSYRGSVHFGSSDLLAALPADYAFTPGDNGVHTFSVMFVTAGTQSITATDGAYNLRGAESGIVVAAQPAQPAATLLVTGAPATTTAGGTFSITVTAANASGGTVTGYTGTVHFTSNNSLWVLPADYTFAAADNGVHTFTVGLKTAALGQYIKVTDTVAVGVSGVSSTFTVTPAAASRFSLANFPTTDAANAAQSFTVAAYDPYNNLATGYAGTVRFTSSDATATLPANYTFTAADSGIHTFLATLRTTGSQSITAADTQTPAVNGSQGSIAVSSPQAGATTSLLISGVPSSATAGAPFNVTVTAQLVNGTTAAGYLGTVHFSSGDGQAALPADYTFTTADAGVHTFSVTFKTAAAGQYLKVADNGGAVSNTKDSNPASPGLAGIATLLVAPGAASRVLVANYPNVTPSGAPHSFTVTALDPYGNVATSYLGTVHFTSNDTAAVLPANYTYTAANAGAATFIATLKTLGYWTLTATDTVTPAITGAQSVIQVNAARIQVGTLPATVTSCTSTSLTVTIRDGAGNVATGYIGTVHFTSTDPLATLPGDYAFKGSDAGTHTFTISMKTSGTQSVAVSDVSSGMTITGASFLVATVQGYTLTVAGYPTTATAGVTQTFAVSERNAQGALLTTTTDTIHFTSSDPQAILPPDYTFTPADGGTHTFSATFKTAGTQSITANDLSCCLSAYETGIQVQPGAATSLTVADYPSPVFANTNQTFVVTARDAYGNLATGYRGTVHFTSDDPLADLPVNYAFTAADAGTHLFSAMFRTPDANSSDTVNIHQYNPNTYFLQGTTYADLNANNQFDTSDAPLAGVTVQLYSADGTTLLGTTTSDANGSYLFSKENVADGQLTGGTYVLVETPPSGYVNAGIQSTTGFNPSTVLSSSRIQVTLPTMTGLTLNLVSPGAGQYSTVQMNGSALSAYAGLLNLKLMQAGSTLATFSGNCVALLQSVGWGDTFNVTAQPSSTGLPYHGGQIAWLIDQFGGAGNALDNEHAAGLQLAVWELQVDPTPDLSAGNFRATTPGVTAGALAYANAYLTQSAGKGAMAIYFNAQYAAGGNSGGHFQGMVTTDSFNFANASVIQPNASVTGYAYNDANNDGKKQATELGVAGSRLTLSGTDFWGRPVNLTTTTAADGSYSFGHLYPGSYSLLESPPAGTIDGIITPGSAGGTAGREMISGITLGSGTEATGYNFGFDRPPTFSSVAVDQVQVGKPYSYTATAADPDADTLTYSKLLGPAGLNVTSTGQVTWTPGSGDLGTQSVRLQVSDNRGGVAVQDFTITVLPDTANRAPHYTTNPIVDAYVGTPYTYPSAAADPDGDTLHFTLTSGPLGLAYSSTGMVAWTPTASQLGLNHVAIKVDDGRGGYANQFYDVMVHPQDSGYIKIISTPTTSYAFPQWVDGATSIVNYATIRDLQQSFPDVQQNGWTGVISGLVNPVLGLLQIAAGNSGLPLPGIVDNNYGHTSNPAGWNTSASFTSTGPNWITDYGGHSGSQLVSSGSGGGGVPHVGANVATWQLTSVPAGDYVVQATWHNATTLASNAMFTITDGGNTVATATVDQTAAPSGATYDSVPFQTLATVHVTSGTLAVVLTDNANGAVAADAIRFVPATDLSWSSLTSPSTASAGSTITIPRTYTISGLAAPSGLRIAYYASPNTALGLGGDLFLGSEILTASTDLSIGSHAGTSPSLQVPAAAGAYHVFAVIDAAGQVNEADETNNVAAASQTLTVSGPTSFTPTFVDDGGSGFSSTGSGWSTTTSGGYGTSYRKTASGGTGLNTATWQLTGLAPGDYQVQATWVAAAGQATNAGFTLKDGGTSIQTVTVDETKNPIGVSYGGNAYQLGRPFGTLATIHVTSGTLGVVLTDLANGPVVADAIRVSRVQPIELNWVGGGVSGPSALSPGASFTIERNYTVTGQAATTDFTIAYYASTKLTPGGGADYLLGSETISAAADKSIGSHDGYSPTLTLPSTGGIYYIYATINAGGSVIENDVTNDVGMVPGRTPTYSGTGQSIHSPQTFNDWYHDVPGTNLSTEFPLVMTRDANDPTLYAFNSPNFFPIDGQLFGNDIPSFPEHNYNFTAEFHGSFVYRGGEQISISSDDDSWVFIDNRLVLDVGGLHIAASGTVSIDQLNRPTYPNGAATLSLVIGQTYPIDIFYAERQTGYAAFSAQTNLQITPEAPYTYPVQAVDSDGGAISYALLKGPLGMSINSATGLVYWQPGRDQVGTYTVTVQAIDATGITDTQTYILTVSLSNGSSLHFTSSYPTAVSPGDSYNYKPVVSAPAGDPLFFTLVSGPNISPTDKMTVNPLTGELNWTPQPGDFGQAFLVTLKVTDNQGGSDVQQFNLKVSSDTNHAPEFSSNVIASGEAGKLYEYRPTATDQDYDALSFDLPVHPSGMIVNPYTGQIDWVPTREQAGTQDVILRVQDGRGGVDLQVFTIKVDPADLPPMIASVPGGKPQVGLPYEYAVIAQDPDNDPLTYSVSVLPAGAAMAFDSTRKNVLIWTPSSTNPVTVTVTVSDGRGWTASQTFNLTAVAPQTDQRPTITSTPRDSIALGLTYIYQIIANDPDGDHLTYVLDTPLDGLTLDSATGLLTWKPTSAQLGLHSLQLHVDDGRTPSLPQAFTVTVGLSPVNGAPRITSTPRLTGVANRLYAYDATAIDPDNDTLAWKLIQAPAGLSINAATGTLRWLPGTAQVGTYPVTIQVADPYGGTALQPFTITVRGTNTPPIINSTPPATGGTASAYSYSVQATDSDGDPLTYSLMGTFPVGLQFSTTTPNLLQWASPVPGTYSLEILVSDGFGGITTQDWTLTVSSGPVDRPPTITSTPSLQDAVGRPYLYAATATDPDAGDTVTFSLAAGAPSWLSMTTAGVLSGTPTAAGSYPLTVIADDNHGGKSYQSFTIAVNTDHAPTISSNAITSVAAGSIYEYAVVASDPDNDPLTYSLVYTLPSGVTAGTPGPAIDQRGRVTWAPGAALKNTSWPVTITVTDTYGLTYSQPYTLAVQGDNTGPSVVVTANAVQANKGQSVTFTVRATDDIAVASLGLTVAGQAVTLDGRGMATVTMNTAGSIAAVGTATDTSGNSGTSQTLYVAVIDTSVTVVPTALITDQASNVTAFNGVSATTHLPVFNAITVPAGASITSTITVNDSAKIQSLTVALGLIDVGNAGLSATLTSPAGTTVTLFSGLTGSNLTGTVFDDAASALITAGTAPYGGRFRPVQALSGLAGKAASGVYTLTITNSSAAPASLTGWSLSYRKTAEAVVTAPVDIIGTATDAQGFTSYTLAAAPAGTNSFVTIGGGLTPVAAGVLGTFDPTLLANGPYDIRLVAANSGGRTTTFTQRVTVSGTLKMGNLHLSFTDLTIPVAGIPITITRTYDTLNAATAGDFGYGWTLGEGSVQLQVTQPNGQEAGPKAPFSLGTRITLTLPGQDPEGFTFAPQPQVTGYFATPYSSPRFIPDAGVYDTLTVQAETLMDNGDGTYSGIDDPWLTPYSPAAYDSQFTLKTASGLTYVFDATDGTILSESDRNGNTLTFKDDGIYSDSGRAATFTRDPVTHFITQIHDPNGNHIDYSYNSKNELVSTTDRTGLNTTTYTYRSTPAHYLDHVNAPTGQVALQATYDNTSGRLTGQADALGNTTTLGYDLGSLSATSTAPGASGAGAATFDAQGNVVSTVDALGNTAQATYSGKDLTTQSQTVAGKTLTTQYSYDAQGRVTRTTDPQGRETYLSYDAYNQPRTITDSLGDTTTLSHDSNGNLLAMASPAGAVSSMAYDAHGNVMSSTTPNGTSSTTYNQFGDVLTRTDARGVTTTFTYDPNGNRTSSSWTWIDPANPSHTQVLTTIYKYDNDDRLYETDAPDGVTKSTYDANGNVKATFDNLNNETDTAYDADGRAVQTTGPDGRFSETVYDAQGRVIWADEAHLSGEPTDGTHTIYDADGRVFTTERYANVIITISKPAGGPASTAYNAHGTLLSVSSTTYDSAGRVVTSTDARNHTVTSKYDDSGELIETDDTVGGVARAVTSTYDAVGRLATTTDALGHTTTYVHDADGRVIRTIYADHTTTRTVYDTAGHQVAAIDQAGNETDYKYNARDDLIEVDLPAVTNPATGKSDRPVYTYTYDTYGNLVTVTDALGRTTTYAYDAFGRRISECLPTLPGGITPTQTWTYNTLGQLTSTTDCNGNVTNDTYDTLGRVHTVAYYAKNSSTAYDTITYAYDTPDGLGGRTNTIASTLSGTLTSYIDVHGNLARIATASLVTVNYTYNLTTGDRTAVTTTNTDVVYAYNDLGQLITVTADKLNNSAASQLTTYAYDLNGDLLTTNLPNGSVETRTYDALNRLASIATTVGSGGSVIFSATYTRDAAGRITVAQENQAGTLHEYDYTYDADGRLTKEIIDPTASTPRTFTYTYDLVGNRVAATDTGAPAGQQSLTYTYDADDRLLYISGTSGYYVSYSYDTGGNTLTTTTGNQVVTNTWDPEGRLVKVVTTVSGTTTQTVLYTYDASGNRTSQSVNGQATTYLNDPNQAYDQVLEEYAPGGVLAVTYVRGLDLLFEDRSGTRSYFAVDQLGSTRALTSPVGAVTDTYTYDAYGQRIGPTGTMLNGYQFAGEQRDASTGLDYLRARYLDTKAGRFTSRDTNDGRTVEPITLNHNLYVGANPVNQIDPSGHEFNLSSINISIGGTIGLITRTLVWGGAGLLAAWVAWSRLSPSSFARWAWPTAWWARYNGPGEIQKYADQHMTSIERSGVYKDADMRAILANYASIYPDVTSGRCLWALDDLMGRLRSVVAAQPAMREGITFAPGELVLANDPEPDNILILLPNQFANDKDTLRMRDANWYDSDAKKNIIFFYPGSDPCRPVGNLYDAVKNSSWKKLSNVLVYNFKNMTF